MLNIVNGFVMSTNLLTLPFSVSDTINNLHKQPILTGTSLDIIGKQLWLNTLSIKYLIVFDSVINNVIYAKYDDLTSR
jgi:hypothetical protein